MALNALSTLWYAMPWIASARNKTGMTAAAVM